MRRGCQTTVTGALGGASVLLVALAWLAGAVARAQTPGTAPATQAATAPAEGAATQQTWAHRAARARAIAALLEQIKAMPLTGSARAGDFLNESDRLEAALAGFLISADEAAPARHASDGTCQVTLTLPVRDVAAALGRIRDDHYRGRRFRAADFAAIVREGAPVELRQSAAAKAPPGLMPPPLLRPRPGAEPFDAADAATRRYWLESVTDAGRRKAEAAARQAAVDRMAAQIEDLPVDEETSLADLAGGRGKPDLRGFLRGARLSGLRYAPSAPVVEAETEIALATVYAAAKAWTHVRHPGRAEQIRRLEQHIVAARGSIAQAGVGCADVADLKSLDPESLATVALASAAPRWAGETLRRTARAALPEGPRQEAIARATRAAQRDARMALAVDAMELKVTDSLGVAELARRDAALRTALLAWLHSAGQARPPQLRNGRVEVTLDLPLLPLWRVILRRAASPPG